MDGVFCCGSSIKTILVNLKDKHMGLCGFLPNTDMIVCLCAMTVQFCNQMNTLHAPSPPFQACRRTNYQYFLLVVSVRLHLYIPRQGYAEMKFILGIYPVNPVVSCFDQICILVKRIYKDKIRIYIKFIFISVEL